MKKNMVIRMISSILFFSIGIPVTRIAEEQAYWSTEFF